jgi:hypothetical protein
MMEKIIIAWRKMMKPMDKEVVILEELIRRAYEHMRPFTYHRDLEWLSNPDLRKGLFDKFPKCFLSLSINRKDVPFFPICNRLGFVDPRIVLFSMKLANKLATIGDPRVDVTNLQGVTKRLEFLHRKYSKEVPKPEDMAVKKAMVTRMLNNVKKYLQAQKGE